MEFKNYKELCNFIDEPYLNGKSKILQLNRWKKSFTFSRHGNHYFIEQITQSPNHFKGKYNSIICPLLLSLIPDEGIITYPELFSLMGISLDPFHPEYSKQYTKIRSHVDYSLHHLASHEYITYSHQRSFSHRLLSQSELQDYCRLEQAAIKTYGIKNTFRKQQIISNDIKTKSYVGYSYPVIRICNLHKYQNTYDITTLKEELRIRLAEW